MRISVQMAGVLIGIAAFERLHRRIGIAARFEDQRLERIPCTRGAGRAVHRDRDVRQRRIDVRPFLRGLLLAERLGGERLVYLRFGERDLGAPNRLRQRDASIPTVISATSVTPFFWQISNSLGFIRRDASAMSGVPGPTPAQNCCMPPPVPVDSSTGEMRRHRPTHNVRIPPWRTGTRSTNRRSRYDRACRRPMCWPGPGNRPAARLRRRAPRTSSTCATPCFHDIRK